MGKGRISETVDAVALAFGHLELLSAWSSEEENEMTEYLHQERVNAFDKVAIYIVVGVENESLV